MIIETMPVLENNENSDKKRAEQLRHSNRKLYLDTQYKLLKEHFGSDRGEIFNLIENEPEKINKFYTNSREAFYQAAFNDKNFLEHRPEEIVEVVDEQMGLIEDLEDKLVGRWQKKDSENKKTEEDLKQWSEDYVHVLTKMLHDDPSLIKRFKLAQDNNPDEQEQILAEIESKLY